jgi:hypothetical protein
MDAEKFIAEIEWLELPFRLPDNRPLQMADWKAANLACFMHESC